MKKAFVVGIAVFGLVIGAAVAKADVTIETDDGARGGQLLDEGVPGGQFTDDDGARGGQWTPEGEDDGARGGQRVLTWLDEGIRGGQLLDEGVPGGQFTDDDGAKGGQNIDDDGARGGQRSPVMVG